MIALRDQKGMTLVEVLVGAALVAMLVMPISLAIYHFISLSHQGNAQLTALHNIQNAARIISRDGQMAESTDLVEGAEPVASLGLAWL
ncbi:MAG: prepilin-type N-terminal cleavage/methylation domain-containing protein, partial [Dehalococcoidia bacterium]